MHDLIPSESGELALIHELQQWNQVSLKRPFQQEIYLFSTYVAGTDYVPDIGRLVSQLEPGMQLQLRREPANRYDKYAILVNDPEGAKMGYVPRADNRVFARLMDAGKRLLCRFKSVDMHHGRVRDLKIRIYLVD